MHVETLDLREVMKASPVFLERVPNQHSVLHVCDIYIGVGAGLAPMHSKAHLNAR